MDEKYKNFAKMRLYNVLLECEAVEITPKELYEELSKSKISLVEKTIDTMFTLPLKKKIDNQLLLLKVMSQLLSLATMVLEKSGYNVETEHKTLDYVNTLLQHEKTKQPPAPTPLIVAKG